MQPSQSRRVDALQDGVELDGLWAGLRRPLDDVVHLVDDARRSVAFNKHDRDDHVCGPRGSVAELDFKIVMLPVNGVLGWRMELNFSQVVCGSVNTHVRLILVTYLKHIIIVFLG
jgi:hypothetical protein